MKFTAMIGQRLKDDHIIELLEAYDITVTYDFDRSHENIDDAYWASAKDCGFLLRFNQGEVLDTVFLYMLPGEDHQAIDRSEVDVPIYDTFDQAQSACAEQRIPYRHRKGILANPELWWIKLDFGTYTVHYQFQHGVLGLITIELKTESS